MLRRRHVMHYHNTVLGCCKRTIGEEYHKLRRQSYYFSTCAVKVNCKANLSVFIDLFSQCSVQRSDSYPLRSIGLKLDLLP